jgi:carboxypeptidase family protein
MVPQCEARRKYRDTSGTERGWAGADEHGCGRHNTSTPINVTVGSALPPDPATVAPPLDRSVATDMATATACLYSGPTPIQTGVAPGTIVPRRSAVLRGTVLDRSGAPLPGVTIAILNHPEFGQTLSRADGMFDLAVNGGGQHTVTYRKAGLLSAQRQLTVPWQDYAFLPNVVLIAADPQVTTINLAAPTPIQAAWGSAQSDTDGTRQATLLFRQGTQADMVLPNGSTQPLTTLHVRATEFTVGPTGPQAMPAALPPASAYTYAVGFAVDEAEALGATQVRFSQPVIAYVENFLHAPVGSIVPVGSHDRQAGQWRPMDNGRAIKSVSLTNGLADVDRHRRQWTGRQRGSASSVRNHARRAPATRGTLATEPEPMADARSPLLPPRWQLSL